MIPAIKGVQRTNEGESCAVEIERGPPTEAALPSFQLLDLPLYFGGKISNVLGGGLVPELTRQPATLFEHEFQFLFALLRIHGRAPPHKTRSQAFWPSSQKEVSPPPSKNEGRRH